MSSIEPEAKDFLVKIATSLSMTLLWMLINCTVGIGLGYGFFETRPGLGNYIFYIWLLASFCWLLIYLYRKWKL
jgi:hypothetical protein